MRSTLLAFVVAAPLLAQTPSMTTSPTRPITIHADRILDGRGKVIPASVVTVEGDKITKIGPVVPVSATYDLKGVTLLPGLIDAHSHLNWYFNRQGRYHTRDDGDTPVESMLSMASNAYATLMAGFTTIQSPGS